MKAINVLLALIALFLFSIVIKLINIESEIKASSYNNNSVGSKVTELQKIVNDLKMDVSKSKINNQ